MTLSLDEDRIADLLRMEDLIPEMEKAMIAFSAGEVTQPVRTLMPVEPHGGYFGPMPAISDEAMGIKLVTFYPGNAERGIHTHHALILLFRPEGLLPRPLRDLARRASVHSLLATRMIAAGQPTGILFAADKQDGLFDENDARLLAAYAQQAALVLERARLFDAVRRAMLAGPITTANTLRYGPFLGYTKHTKLFPIFLSLESSLR